MITAEEAKALLDAATPGELTMDARWAGEAFIVASHAVSHLLCAAPDIAKAYLAAEARVAVVLALADEWAAVDGVDQRAATLHTVADRLRAVLDPDSKERVDG